MKRLSVFIVLALLPAVSCGRGNRLQSKASETVKYGANPSAGRFFTHDGVRLYYEVYGAGEPLLLIHGNGNSIGGMAAQIAYFRKNYQVIAMDSRDHGQSADSPDKLTFEKMTDDVAALLDHLAVGPVHVLGWSDGAIQGLLLGIHHPTLVKKIAAMGANLNPTEEAVHPEVIEWVKQSVASVPEAERATLEGRRSQRLTALMLEEPHIDPKALEAITAPTLVLAGDHDVIRDEHTLQIYHHLPNGQLAVFPDAIHRIPYDDPDTFNATVDRFFRTPFVKRDRLRDFVTSLKKNHAEVEKNSGATAAAR